VGQNSLLALSALANIECAWFNSGPTQAGPSSSGSLIAQVSLLGSPNTVNLEAKAKTVVASTATLRCRFSGVALSLGGFRSSGWSSRPPAAPLTQTARTTGLIQTACHPSGAARAGGWHRRVRRGGR